jgi:hypothetical protein
VDHTQEWACRLGWVGVPQRARASGPPPWLR